MKNHCGCYKLNAIVLGFAAAVVCALGMVVLGVANMHYGMGAKWIELIATVYQGYAATWHGIAVGAGYAAVKGFFSGLVFGWIYNLCAYCIKKCCGCLKTQVVEKTTVV